MIYIWVKRLKRCDQSGVMHIDRIMKVIRMICFIQWYCRTYYCTVSICNTVENNDLTEDMWTWKWTVCKDGKVDY